MFDASFLRVIEFKVSMICHIGREYVKPLPCPSVISMEDTGMAQLPCKSIHSSVIVGHGNMGYMDYMSFRE